MIQSCTQPSLNEQLGVNTALHSHRTAQLGENSCSVPRQQRAHQMPERRGLKMGQQTIRCQCSKQHDGRRPKVRILHGMMLRWQIQHKPGQTFWMGLGASMRLWMLTNARALTYKHRLEMTQSREGELQIKVCRYRWTILEQTRDLILRDCAVYCRDFSFWAQTGRIVL